MEFQRQTVRMEAVFTKSVGGCMEELLRKLVGTKIDVNCGTNVFYRGEVMSSGGGILELRDEDGREVFIAEVRITAISPCKDQTSRPGFVV